MKRFNRSERIGIILLSAVVLLLTGGVLLLRQCTQQSADNAQPITIMTMPSDSMQTPANKSRKKSNRDDEEEDYDASDRSCRRPHGTRRGSHSPQKHKQIQPGQNRPPRDFLSDTIPTTVNRIATDES